MPVGAKPHDGRHVGKMRGVEQDLAVVMHLQRQEDETLRQCDVLARCRTALQRPRDKRHVEQALSPRIVHRDGAIELRRLSHQRIAGVDPLGSMTMVLGR